MASKPAPAAANAAPVNSKSGQDANTNMVGQPSSDSGPIRATVTVTLTFS